MKIFYDIHLFLSSLKELMIYIYSGYSIRKKFTACFVHLFCGQLWPPSPSGSQNYI